VKRSLRTVGPIAALATFVAVATAAVTAGDQADGAVAKQLLGTWRLVNWTQHLADGTERPAATDAGILIYTEVNRMCAMIMDSRRAKWAPGPPASVEDAVRRNAGYVSYCATVELNAKEGFILHHVDLERNPNVIGTTRKRWFSFQGPDTLRLRIDAAELPASVKESVLVWQRVVK
jgi:hypothetical protein